uniref:Trehalose-6-phosphate synthase n=1 Tax=Meloidogyne incognita TaxID=6306 RepID=A0A914L8I4_MELIC
MENNKENVWVFHATASNSNLPSEDDPKLQAIEEHKSKSAFGLRSVLIDDETYHYYYEDISNCILWPALHNIQENITVHDNERDFNEAINAYKNVNKQFAQTIFDLERTENDFIWIQDYHLMLVGSYLRQMENKNNFKNKKPMELGFFLHTPFELAEGFTEKFTEFGLQIINGILNFDKVGFQTNKDRQKFIKLAVKLFHLKEEHKPKNIINLKNNYITPVNGCNLGVYPATINVNEFIKIAEMESTLIEAKEFRENIMANSLEGGKLFFSVERFDYTKGIYEKLEGFKRYLERYPDRIGRDVFYQIAPYNRRNIENYKNYQNNSLKIKERIKIEFGEGSTRRNDIKIPEGYEPFIIELEGVPREKLVTRYLAMDVGVVTPVMDGMNLVAKEMIASNPRAPLILSKGAGTHHQLKENGLSGNYFLVEDIKNSEHFANVLHDSTVLSEEAQKIRGEKLREYLKKHSVDK